MNHNSGQYDEDYAVCYEALGLDGPCSSEKLKAAYRRRVGKFHPDRVADPKLSLAYTEKLQEINRAYKTLSEYEEIFGLLPPNSSANTLPEEEPFSSSDSSEPPAAERERSCYGRQPGRFSRFLGLSVFIIAGYFLVNEVFVTETAPEQAIGGAEQTGVALPGSDMVPADTHSLGQGDSTEQAPGLKHHEHSSTAHIAAQPEVSYDILQTTGKPELPPPAGPLHQTAGPSRPGIDEDIRPEDLWNPEPYNPVADQ